MCGFSGQVVQILDHLGVTYKGLNVLESDESAERHQDLFQLADHPAALRQGRVRRRLRHRARDVPGGRAAVPAQGQGRCGEGTRPDAGPSPSPISGVALAVGLRTLLFGQMLRTRLAAAARCRWRLLAAADAQARITEIRIDSVEPFANGHAFGDAGAYVRIKGVAKGELDPKSPQNAVIVDLDKAPRNARGMVEYETDIYIMRPADPAKGSGILLYEVVNRGRKSCGRSCRIAPTTPAGSGRSEDARRCRQRLCVRARLYARVVRLGPRRADRRWRPRHPRAGRDRRTASRSCAASATEFEFGTRGRADVDRRRA